MNIFFLDRDPIVASQYHCDKHVVKMILETAQLLSTAHHVLGTKHPELIYKQTHTNHPCGTWVRQSSGNYLWTHALLGALCTEYTLRYGRVHATQSKGIVDALKLAPDTIKVSDFSEPPQCMPDVFKAGDSVTAYRNYYRNGKKHMTTWKTKTPCWWDTHLFME
jgi:hypothetical protein